MAKPRHGNLSADDQALWRQVSDSARPLSYRAKLRSGTAMPAAPGAPKREALAPPLPVKTASGVDGAAIRRRGQIEPDSRIDLHGLTQAAAHARLERFVAEASDRGHRCVLVITGKGLAKGAAGGPGDETANPDAPFMRRPGWGVLRDKVPAWLGEGDNRGRVISHQPAHPRHGGAGALYVFLRRRRPPSGASKR